MAIKERKKIELYYEYNNKKLVNKNNDVKKIHSKFINVKKYILY